MNFFKALDKFMRPREWRKRNRRIFVATIPISGPLWLALCMFIVMFAIILMIITPLVELWEDEG